MRHKTRQDLRNRRDQKELTKGMYQGRALEQLRSPSTPKPTSVFNKLWDKVLGPKDSLKIRR
jgi:hypothetical protein